MFVSQKTIFSMLWATQVSVVYLVSSSTSSREWCDSPAATPAAPTTTSVAATATPFNHHYIRDADMRPEIVGCHLARHWPGSGGSCTSTVTETEQL